MAEIKPLLPMQNLDFMVTPRCAGITLGDMGFFQKVVASAKVGLEAEKQGKPFVVGTSGAVLVEPVDINAAIEYMGLPGGTSLHTDDATYDMWMRKTNLTATDNRNYYLGELRNEGKRAAFFIGPKRIGYLDEMTLPEAVKALGAHGGMQAPAVLKITKEGSRTDSVIVGKPGWHWEK
jgi:hypothetical protein